MVGFGVRAQERRQHGEESGKDVEARCSSRARRANGRVNYPDIRQRLSSSAGKYLMDLVGVVASLLCCWAVFVAFHRLHVPKFASERVEFC